MHLNIIYHFLLYNLTLVTSLNCEVENFFLSALVFGKSSAFSKR